MKLKLLAIIPLLLCVSGKSNGQELRSQAGFRSGITSGIYYQVQSNRGSAEIGYNALLSFRNNGAQITVLQIFYEITLDEISPDLYLVWGYGGHAGFYVSNSVRFLNEDYYFNSERFIPLIGIDGFGGIEYRFRGVPLSLSLNLKPYAELTIPAFVKLVPGDLGISVAYRF